MEAECTSVDRSLLFLVGGARQSLFICRSDFSLVGCWSQIICLSVRQLIGGIRLFVCLPACLPACLSVCLYVCKAIEWSDQTVDLSVHLAGGNGLSVGRSFGGWVGGVSSSDVRWFYKYRSKIDLFAYSVDLTVSILTASVLLSCNRLTIFSFF